MADAKHWEVANEREMWLKVVGHEQEDRTETIVQAQKIFKDIPAGLICFEIGCGPGRFVRDARSLFKKYRGSDISRTITDFAPQIVGFPFESVAMHITDGLSIPLGDNWADFVFSFTCFQHMPTLEMVRCNLAEAYRVLKPGGLCRIQTVQGDYLESGRYDGVVFKTVHDFAEEFKSLGFSIEDAHLDGEWIWITARKR